jgi:uncharacterized protein (TIGR02145 family)
MPVLGCTDINFSEFNPLATVNDGSCATPSFLGCTDDRYAEYDPQANVDDGSCQYLVGCGPDAVVVYHGESYPLVTIGEQCWFKKNLNTPTHRSGDAITLLEDNAEWAAASGGAWSYYGNNVANGATYGKLYNFYAVSDSRGLCPTGWHVPSDEEWYTLENSFGGSAVAGIAMKSSPTDIPSWDGSNASGFSGLPAGGRNLYGDFNSLGISGYWWSSSPDGVFLIYRYLFSGVSDVYTSISHSPHFGFSVRCIRD